MKVEWQIKKLFRHFWPHASLFKTIIGPGSIHQVNFNSIQVCLCQTVLDRQAPSFILTALFSRRVKHYRKLFTLDLSPLATHVTFFQPLDHGSPDLLSIEERKPVPT